MKVDSPRVWQVTIRTKSGQTQTITRIAPDRARAIRAASLSPLANQILEAIEIPAVLKKFAASAVPPAYQEPPPLPSKTIAGSLEAQILDHLKRLGPRLAIEIDNALLIRTKLRKAAMRDALLDDMVARGLIEKRVDMQVRGRLPLVRFALVTRQEATS